jgi:hypothetical protein
VTLRAPAQLDFTLNPPTAALTLQLTYDGSPLDGGRLLLGPYGLPLLKDRLMPPLVTARLGAEELGWLDAARGPLPGNRGDVLLWRDPGSVLPGLVEAKSSSGGDDVATMMRRWGYAR